MQNENIAKVIIPLSKCVPGMILLQPIVDIDTGSTIIGKDQLLTEDILRRIKKFKHTEIWVGINREESMWQIEENVLNTYDKYIEVLKNIIGSKREGIDIKVNEVENLAKCITEEFVYNFNVLACVSLVEKMDQDIYRHSMNVTLLSLLIARWANFNPVKLKQVAMAGLLHDIGKIDMPSQLIDKTKDLTVKEKVEFRRHPIYAYEKLSQYNELDNEVLKAVLTHHERCDGSGYPLNLIEDRINDISRVVGLADEYDNIRRTANIFETIKILKCDMIRKFDINMLLEFCNNVINYYIGEKVVLSTGEIAEVVFIQPHALHRPIVKVKERYVDLYENIQIEIIEVL
ncbi:HD-GYP domain-containing protein [Cellulosilyticum sp. I15G10I2]|uniref:HD-GYP domain-containing protein n=1 Tax=Cellulosilyticum sp. I15G10I2 TaxID=1892843 RepID=UPI00085BBDC8|nr:HD domain-containing phosphohydrolase [Cellulosilyticum sp. I15G10I2]